MIVKGKLNKFWLVFTIYFVLISVGIPLHEHYCKGNLKLVQIFSEPETCHSSDLVFHKTKDCCSSKCDSALPKGECCSTEKGNCCTNKYELKKIEFQATIEKKDFSKNTSADKPINSDFTICNKIVFFHECINFKKNGKLYQWKKPNGKNIITFNQQFIC